jgi:hypothetical protein
MRAIVEDGRVVGIMTLFKNEVRRKIGATREVIETLKTEDDRVRAVEKYFFIPLTPEDREGIKNTGLALGQE